jgi:transcriptional regulator with XRE-family HTH domain
VDKSITSQEYRVFLRKLRAARRESGLTQVALADRLGETQSFVSKCERGERRLDIVEVRSFCQAFGVSLAAFARQLDRTLTNASRLTAKRPRP